MSFGFTNFPNGLSPGSQSNFLVRFVLTFDFVKNVSSKGDKFELVSSFPIFLDFQINFKAPVATITFSFSCSEVWSVACQEIKCREVRSVFFEKSKSWVVHSASQWTEKQSVRVHYCFFLFHPLPKAPRGVQILLSETVFSCLISFPYGW